MLPLLSAQHDAIFGRRGFENNKPLQVTHAHTHTHSHILGRSAVLLGQSAVLFVQFSFAATSAFFVDQLIHMPSAGHISMAAGYLPIWRVQILLPQSPKVSFVIIMNSQCRLDLATSKMVGHVQYPSKNIKKNVRNRRKHDRISIHHPPCMVDMVSIPCSPPPKRKITW